MVSSCMILLTWYKHLSLKNTFNLSGVIYFLHVSCGCSLCILSLLLKNILSWQTESYLLIFPWKCLAYALPMTGTPQIYAFTILCYTTPLLVGRTSLHNEKSCYKNNNKPGLNLQLSDLKALFIHSTNMYWSPGVICILPKLEGREL